MSLIKKIINDILDRQNRKGIQTYGRSLEDCPNDEFDWQEMTIEELIDALQYQVKQNILLKKNLLAGNSNTNLVLIDVGAERFHQDFLWGKQRRQDYGKWLKILVEEIGEVAQAMQKNESWNKDTDASDLYAELIQVAAVAVAIAEQVKEEESDELSTVQK